jgi:thiol-disulfide isomerase/thioredoxin
MKFLFLLLSFLILSCAGAGQKYKSNSSLVVEYEGEEVHRREQIKTLPKITSKYVSEPHLKTISNQKKEFIVIFAADWCGACKLTRKAISQANLNIDVYYVNIEEKWVAQLASIMEIKKIPFMIHVGQDNNTVAVRAGPGKIVTYLVSKF